MMYLEPSNHGQHLGQVILPYKDATPLNKVSSSRHVHDLVMQPALTALLFSSTLHLHSEQNQFSFSFCSVVDNQPSIHTLSAQRAEEHLGANLTHCEQTIASLPSSSSDRQWQSCAFIYADSISSDTVVDSLANAFFERGGHTLFIAREQNNQVMIAWHTHKKTVNHKPWESKECHLAMRLLEDFKAIHQQFKASDKNTVSPFHVMTHAERQYLNTLLQAESSSPEPELWLNHARHIAKQTPQKIAAYFNEATLTYAALIELAQRAANALSGRQLKAQDKIVVCFTTGLDILPAIAATHWLNAVYVPLDPTFPEARIQAILQVLSPDCILIEKETRQCIPTDYENILLDWAEATLAENTPLEPPRFLANTRSHIFFTSGTTGKPKGVVATHGNLLHYLDSARQRFEFTADDTFAAAARFTFSISLFELLNPLNVGGAVYFLERETVLNLPALAKALTQVTVLHFGPSLLKQLLPHLESQLTPNPLSNIRHASSGGDIVPSKLLNALQAQCPNAEVFVLYGSSEISCMGLHYNFSKSNHSESRIGKPFTNTRALLLNSDRHQVPTGAIGEIYISGPGVIPGYLDQESLTREKFIHIDGQRFYAMGDIGRLDNNGDIEMLGRRDFQVQIRGMRVEVLEVEACIKRFDNITDCVVYAPASEQNNCNDASLVAYIVCTDISATGLWNYLRKNLPDYMVPSQIVRLAQLPTNHNNKIDRSQLPTPSVTNTLLSGEHTAAEDDIERQVVTTFENALNQSSISTVHNFFELGGDSLRAVQVLAQIDIQLRKFIPINFFYKNPTAKQLANAIRNDISMEGSELVLLRDGNQSSPLFCLYGLMLYHDLAQTLPTDKAVFGVYLQEELEQANTFSKNTNQTMSVEDIAERYYQIILRAQRTGPYYLCGESFGGIIALEVAKLLIIKGESVAFIGLLDSNAPGFLDALSRTQKLRIHCKQMLRNPRDYIQKHLLSSHDSKSISDDIKGKDQRANARAAASATYAPGVFDGQATLFRASERSAFEPPWPDLGWNKYIKNLTVYEVSGDHLGMLKPQHVNDLAGKMSNHLK